MNRPNPSTIKFNAVQTITYAVMHTEHAEPGKPFSAKVNTHRRLETREVDVTTRDWRKFSQFNAAIGATEHFFALDGYADLGQPNCIIPGDIFYSVIGGQRSITGKYSNYLWANFRQNSAVIRSDGVEFAVPHSFSDELLTWMRADFLTRDERNEIDTFVKSALAAHTTQR